MECPLWALNNLGVSYEHVQACDLDPAAKEFYRLHFPNSSAIYNHDMTKRPLRSSDWRGRIDVYVAGFPCPSWSTMGLGQGASGKGGEVVAYVIATLGTLLPKTFCLENVEGLVTRRPDALAWILSSLRDLSGQRYFIDARLMNASEHGLPQNRPRLFIVGIDKALLPRGFRSQWPEPIGHVPLELLLDPQEETVTTEHMPPATQATARRNFVQAFTEIVTRLKVNPLQTDIVADIDGGWGVQDVVPCLTRGRSGAEGHWVMNRGRRLRLQEISRLMGIPFSQLVFSKKLSHNQMGKLLGNGMAVPVLERIFRVLLSSAGLAPLSAMAARWESMTAATASAVSLSD